MGSFYKGDHIAYCGDHYTACKMEEQHQIAALERSVKDHWLGFGSKHILLDPNLRSLLLQWFETVSPHKGFLTPQRINTGKKHAVVLKHLVRLKVS